MLQEVLNKYEKHRPFTYDFFINKNRFFKLNYTTLFEKCSEILNIIFNKLIFMQRNLHYCTFSSS